MSTSTKAWIGVLLAGTVGIVIFLFVHLSSDPSHPVEVGTAKASACNKAQDECLPDVSYVDTDGKKYTADQLAGKVVVINFWATWCGPCKREIPDLSKAYDKFKAKGVQFLGVLINDDASDGDLLNFRSDFNMSYPVVRGGPDVFTAFGRPSALPTTFVYDRGGKRVYQHLGPLTEDAFGSLLNQYVAEK
jgi:thiol-disulfide isomerase/thioredoxin